MTSGLLSLSLPIAVFFLVSPPIYGTLLCPRMNTPMYGLTNPNGNQTKPNTPTQQNNVYNNKLNSKLVGSVPSLMDYEYSLPMNTQFYERKTNIANRLVLYHACFAVSNAKTASLCGDVLRLFCDHELSSCKLFCTLLCLF